MKKTKIPNTTDNSFVYKHKPNKRKVKAKLINISNKSNSTHLSHKELLDNIKKLYSKSNLKKRKDDFFLSVNKRISKGNMREERKSSFELNRSIADTYKISSIQSLLILPLSNFPKTTTEPTSPFELSKMGSNSIFLKTNAETKKFETINNMKISNYKYNYSDKK